MRADVQADALKRLNYIEGHLAGIGKMIEDDRYCMEILKQTYAVRRALEAVEANILEGHLETHVVDGIKEGRERQVIDELMELYGLANQLSRT
ncbi:MAG: metal-sensitive transcriptional regulator [Chloroflexi bacterium]|nr:metal-sensitive transcriptional regulator [Chloroflexota bacterium]MCZ6866842.1 metal-sensitive transcriptional regulator [Chloroflexota bacterium]